MEKSRKLFKRTKHTLNIVFFLVFVTLCFLYLEVNPLSLLAAVPVLVRYLASNFFPPSLANLDTYVNAVLQTAAVALLATYISAAFSFLFAILMVDELVPFASVRVLARFVMAFLRNIPVVIWVTLLVFVFGIGSMVGLVAMVLAATGFLARTYGECMNEIASKKLEALKACGASTPQLIYHGILPEFLPAWVNWTLFTFEVSIRASAILGMVGAGGIGILIQTHLSLRNFNEVGTLVLVLVLMVLFTEFLTGLIRKKIR